MAIQTKNQFEFFKVIRHKVEPEANLARTIAQLICVSESTAYKLISQEMSLVGPKYRILRDFYSVSIENFYLGDPEKQTLSDIIHLPIDDMEKYLKNLELMYTKLKEKASECTVSWAATAIQIPVFHMLAFPELTFLSMYARSRNSNNKTQSFEAFVQSIPAKEIAAIHKKIYLLMKSMDAKVVVLEVGLSYYKDLIMEVYNTRGFDHKDTAIRLLNQTSDMILQMMEWAESGSMDGEGKFNLHVSKLDLLNNMILLFSDGKPYHYVDLSMGAQVLFNGSDVLCKQAENTLNYLTHKNPCMCGGGATLRDEIFNKVLMDLADTINKLH